jgi:hypothetical protein
MDVQHIGQSKMTIDVSIDRYNLKFCEHDGHSMLSVFTMIKAFPSRRGFLMTTMIVLQLYQILICKSRVW